MDTCCPAAASALTNILHSRPHHAPIMNFPIDATRGSRPLLFWSEGQSDKRRVAMENVQCDSKLKSFLFIFSLSCSDHRVHPKAEPRIENL